MKRYLEIELEDSGRKLCEGILLGLYRVRDGGSNDVLGWAPDFPAEAASDVLDVWMSAGAAAASGAHAKRKRRRLSSAFVQEHLPGWDWVLKHGAADR